MNKEIIDSVNTFLFDRSLREHQYMDGCRSHCLIKSRYDDEVDFLYHMYAYQSPHPQAVGQELNYAGMISYKRGLLFDPAYHMRDWVESTPDLDTLVKSASELIRLEIQRLVNGQPVEVTAEAEACREDREYFQKYEASAAAYRLFYAGKSTVEYTSGYAIARPSTADTIRIIHDEQNYVRDSAQAHVKKGANAINQRLWELSMIRERLHALINDPGEHHKRRAIANSITGDMKMVHVHVNRDGLIGVFKVDAHAVIHRACDNDTINTHWMDAPSRRDFEAQYGRYEHLRFCDITRITYGKRVLFQQA